MERVNYLVDTNIWHELLLNQQKADVVQRFFQTIQTSELAISEFTVCSIGLILILTRPFSVENLQKKFSPALLHYLETELLYCAKNPLPSVGEGGPERSRRAG